MTALTSQSCDSGMAPAYRPLSLVPKRRGPGDRQRRTPQGKRIVGNRGGAFRERL